MKHLIGFLLMDRPLRLLSPSGDEPAGENQGQLQFQAHLPELRSIYSATQAIERSTEIKP